MPAASSYSAGLALGRMQRRVDDNRTGLERRECERKKRSPDWRLPRWESGSAGRAGAVDSGPSKVRAVLPSCSLPVWRDGH
ncbi:hypothetical protein JMJ77_0005869 [Colletotrichum scovillei]|uniref:Uncharacterized protein n=1 Tax=Colletotrichum scovillei TaxID=1209932 RepID=A0A9P7UHU3_9PEZI|nr:hypothetical protein JMJ77_0005869 [Colletotrichum scovillei]KAG7077096.1 hypothetical protein JMJ76_0014350 [Colletotrichum scovillei]KAG7084207.1 hypothetical protein JMJ78_0009646 [Colletotrichum scovillei]